ncbi:MAG: acetyl-CoA carboxylase carboxyltransferase subunit alpha [Oscillospiraceae bacterium]
MNNSLSAWERIEIIRNKNRPTIQDYIPLLFDKFIELHGDRYYGDDHAIIGGIAYFKSIPVTVISQVKGRNFDENKKANFAMPHPEGYRKALRLMKQAEKFRRPIICFVDTPGAFCGIEAEKRGQGEAIARNLFEMMRLKTPIITIVLGEGGSGGALALAVSDHLAMMENAVYSIISPRGFASILWKDDSKEKEAAEIMKITAPDLVRLGVAQTIIDEPFGGSHNDHLISAENIATFLEEHLNYYLNKPLTSLLEERYNRYRIIGEFSE